MVPLYTITSLRYFQSSLHLFTQPRTLIVQAPKRLGTRIDGHHAFTTSFAFTGVTAVAQEQAVAHGHGQHARLATTTGWSRAATGRRLSTSGWQWRGCTAAVE